MSKRERGALSDQRISAVSESSSSLDKQPICEGSFWNRVLIQDQLGLHSTQTLTDEQSMAACLAF